jgi:PKD repeat protein
VGVHVYTADASFMVKLTVRDSDGLSDFAMLTVKVYRRGANEPPVAQFTNKPASPSTGQTVEFDASGSADEDPLGLNFSWEFGDGTSGTGKFASHKYNSKGTYKVKLKVTDTGGLSGIYSTSVQVSGPSGGLDNQLALVLWGIIGLTILGVAVLAVVILTRRKRKAGETEEAGPRARLTTGAAAPASGVSLISPASPASAPLVVEKGLNYLIDGPTTDHAYKAIEKLGAENTKLLVFTHVHPKKMAKIHTLKEAELIWLSELTEDVPSLDPAKMDYEITEKILTFVKENKSGGVVFIDGLDVLAQTHGFDKVLEFIHSINEVATVNESTIIVPVNSKAMKEIEYNQLKQKFDRS